jgi:hypothetical protein
LDVTFRTVQAVDGTIVEGSPGGESSGDAAGTALLEACLSEGADRALLYAADVPELFFDLSSGVAGALLQRLRNYGIRLALVVRPGEVTPSSRFGEMVAEEARGHAFGVFASREAALTWLGAADPSS